MKKFYAILLLLALALHGHTQGVGIGTTAPNGSAQLDITSTNKGVLLPRVTTAQRQAIASPAFGLLVFDTDKGCLYLFDGQNWKPMIFSSETDVPSLLRTPVNSNLPAVDPIDMAGGAVAVSGNFAIGTNPNADNQVINTGATAQGEAYVFSKATNWTQTQLIRASDAGASQHDCFGFSIDMLGTLAVIGAPGATIGANVSQGAVYVFSYNGSEWTQIQKLVAPGNANDFFGFSVSTDGNTIAVGAPGSQVGGVGTGAVYTFTPNPIAGSGVPWVRGTTLSNPGGAGGDSLGFSVNVNGAWLVAGAPAASSKSGYACVFGQSGTNFVFYQTLSEIGPAASHRYGASVAIDQTPAIYIGSPGTNLFSPMTGTFYTYGLTTTWTGGGGYAPTSGAFSDMGAFIHFHFTNANIFCYAYYEKSTGLRVYQGNTSSNTFTFKVTASPDLYPVAVDGNTVVYIDRNGFNFKNLQ